ncbi:MAG: MaoC family dehydratase N-terminal domain-containing protein [Acetobacteraceae bacterium]|nr:MaoC family dehydratase N-terminal domain-containing protein [Acetobacteraceae bacterium]
MSTTVVEPSDAQAQAFLDQLIGPLGEAVQVQVELGAVRRMSLCMGNLDPIHFDQVAAQQRGYRGIVAPWPLLWLYFFTCTIYEHDFPFGKATVHGADEYEFHEPMIVGDVLTVSTAMVAAKLKHGKVGRLGQITSERRFVNQRGELCAVLRTILFRR